MQLIGLAGRAGSGKDTVADYLVEKYGFVKFSFSDALYQEVQEAYGLPNQDLLRSRETKEVPTDLLSLSHCSDNAFILAAYNALANQFGGYPLTLEVPLLSPRWVLQTWGTEYRRKQDPDYWIKKAHAFVEAFKQVADPETCGGLANTSVRFPNEVEYIRSQNGVVWHIHRDSLPPMDNSGHVSEVPVPYVFGRDKELHNNSTIDRLRTGVSILYSTNSQRIFVEDESTVFIDEVK